MKIVIESFTICAGGEQSPLEDLSGAFAMAVQEVAFVRAEEIKLFDRKLARTDLSFTVLYKRSSIPSAESYFFQLGFDPRFIRFGKVQFTSESNTGGGQLFYLHNAAAQITGIRQIGSALLVTWNIRGGKITQNANP